MDYRKLGSSGLKVASICLGTAYFGATADEPTSHSIMNVYVEAGGNFIDTADVYNAFAPGHVGGESETIIGHWMNERRNRLSLVIATKVQGRMWSGPNGVGLSRGHIMRAVEDSLNRLGTDYIDLYQTHWPDYDTPQEETLRALDDLVRAGKVRYFGYSNEPAWRMCKAMWISEHENLNRIVSAQPPYSLVNRAHFEREQEAVCLDQGIGVIPWSPLQGGFLTGKYRRDHMPTPQRVDNPKNYGTEKNFQLIDLLEALGRPHNATISQMALAWMLQRKVITAPIIGANTTQQLSETLGCVNVKLTPEDVNAIDTASEWHKDEF
jgi:aryl-alcohol dehydrogenase-like predicted oxidoreductase